MADTGSGSGSDAEFQAAIGQILLDLSREWQDVQKRGLNTHALGVMRDVYGALALQIGVRAAELRGSATQRAEELARIQSDLRTELSDAVSTIRR